MSKTTPSSKPGARLKPLRPMSDDEVMAAARAYLKVIGANPQAVAEALQLRA